MCSSDLGCLSSTKQRPHWSLLTQTHTHTHTHSGHTHVNSVHEHRKTLKHTRTIGSDKNIQTGKQIQSLPLKHTQTQTHTPGDVTFVLNVLILSSPSVHFTFPSLDPFLHALDLQ